LRPDLGKRLKEQAAEIAFPRAAGSAGNERARRIVRERFTEAGLHVEEQSFSYDLERAFRAIRWTLRGAAVAVGTAAALVTIRPGIASVALAAAILGGAVLLAWAPGIEKLYAADGPTSTANVIARRPASGPRRKTLIVLAHYDSKSQNLTFPWRMGSTLLAIFGTLTLTSCLVSRLDPLWSQVGGGLAAAALALLSTLRNENRSPGGTDNAGSVAILLELARELPGSIPPDVELVLLSPSAEEDHMVGAMRWLSRNLATEQAGGTEIVAINIDGAGSPGRAVAMQWFGFGRRFGPTIIRAAREASATLAIPMRRIWLPPAIGVDAIPFVHRGIECVTFSSGSLGRETMAVHSAKDVADNLGERSLENVYRLVHETARGLMA
jgi:hypothetical protein